MLPQRSRSRRKIGIVRDQAASGRRDELLQIRLQHLSASKARKRSPLRIHDHRDVTGPSFRDQPFRIEERAFGIVGKDQRIRVVEHINKHATWINCRCRNLVVLEIEPQELLTTAGHP